MNIYQLIGLIFSGLTLVGAFLIFLWRTSSQISKLFFRMENIEKQIKVQGNDHETLKKTVYNHREVLRQQDSSLKDDVQRLDKKFDLMHQSMINLTKNISDWVAVQRDELKEMKRQHEERISRLEEETKEIQIKLAGK